MNVWIHFYNNTIYVFDPETKKEFEIVNDYLVPYATDYMDEEIYIKLMDEFIHEKNSCFIKVHIEAFNIKDIMEAIPPEVFL